MIVLNDVTSGFNTSTINSNFQKIEDALNTQVLYRDVPVGTDNAMQDNLDMNNKRIYNLPAPIASNEPVRLIDLQNASIGGGGGGGGSFSGLASDVNITDAGGYYTGSNVEVALQEIGNDIVTLQSASGTSTANLVSVKDAPFNAKGDYDYGTGTGTDDTAAIQAAINHCITNGRRLFFPKGIYKVTATLNMDYTGVTADPTQTNGRNRISLEGEGGGATALFGTFAGAILNYQGGTSGSAGVHSFFNMRGIGLHNGTRNAGSIGIKMDNCSFWTMDDVSILGFKYGIKGTDVLSGQVSNSRIWSNIYGYRFEYTDFSRPNAITMDNVRVAGNRRYGGYVLNGASFRIQNGSIEGNGTDSIGLGDADATRLLCWGVKIEDAGTEGALGLDVDGTYIEGNSGRADIWISQLNNVAHHSIKAGFLRFLATQYTVANILFDSSVSTAAARCSVEAGFKSQSPYTASSLRPYIQSSRAASVYDVGCTFDNQTEVDRAVFGDKVMGQMATSSLPTPGVSTLGQMLYNSTAASPVISDLTKWRYLSDHDITVQSSDTNLSYTVFTHKPNVIWTATLAADRNHFLNLTNAYQGARVQIARVGGGSGILNVGSGLCFLRQNMWCEVIFDGSSWILFKTGYLTNGTFTHVRATRNSALNIGRSTDTQIPYDTEEYDTLNEYNAATGLFTATYTGWYHVSAAATTNQFAWLAGTQFFLKLFKNGSNYAVGMRDFKSVNSTANSSASSVVNTDVYLLPGETLAVIGFTDRTPTADLNNISGSSVSNYLTISRLY